MKTTGSGLKVVARLRGGKLIKGYVEAFPITDFDELIQKDPWTLPLQMGIRSAESSETLSVPLNTLKALFFVRSFNGSKDYEEVKFFEKNPPIRGLWVQVKFYDNEFIEGVVRNSLHYLVDPGFFLKPPDPKGNNEILYVIKESLAAFHVLGAREEY
jgi:hypothetical protein